MRFTQNEKYEIIRLVEDSELGVNRHLASLIFQKGRFTTGMEGILSMAMMDLHLKYVPLTVSGIEYLTKFEMKWLNWLWKFQNYLQESLLTE
jgi:hypothetical protein